ncbi:TRAP transporter large permease subunit [Chloroflexota bacterium]
MYAVQIKLNLDKSEFRVIITIVIEMALITPPVGMDVYH